VSDTLVYSGQLVVVTCWCGMRHAIPSELDDFQDRQHDDGEKQTAIYCPLGHSHIRAGKGEAAKLRERLQRERDHAARLAAERDQMEASRNAFKGAATRARKRASAGVCPCCNRTFKQLARHMKAKHSDFNPDPDEKAAASSERPAA
jgi:hypothetical protein